MSTTTNFLLNHLISKKKKEKQYASVCSVNKEHKTLSQYSNARKYEPCILGKVQKGQ